MNYSNNFAISISSTLPQVLFRGDFRNQSVDGVIRQERAQILSQKGLIRRWISLCIRKMVDVQNGTTFSSIARISEYLSCLPWECEGLGTKVRLTNLILIYFRRLFPRRHLGQLLKLPSSTCALFSVFLDQH